MENSDTHPKLMKWWYEKFGNQQVCHFKKDFGIWQASNWADYYHQAKYFSLGLISLGFKWGDNQAIVGDNAPEWSWAQAAAQAAGGVGVGIYVDSSPSEIKYILQDSEPTIVLAGDQEQVDKLLEIKNEIPTVKKIIYWEGQGLVHYDDPILMSWRQVLELGKEYEKEHPDLFENNIAKGKGSDPAIILYTSGTTGFPKGVVRTHNSLIRTVKSWSEIYGVTWQDERVSFYPPAWILEQNEGITTPLVSGLRVSYPETVDTANADLRERGPSILFTSPRIWEGMTSTVQTKITDTGALQKLCYKLFLPFGYKIAELKSHGKKIGLVWKILYAVANLLLFKSLRDRLGLSKVRLSFTSGSILSPDVIRFMRALGISIRQIYGLTEIAPVSVQIYEDEIDPITSGQPLPGNWVRIDNNGEILVRGEGLFSGYYGDPERTKEKIVDGWMHTGDAGYIDEKGHLVCIDRAEDLVTLPNGGNFSPQYIESRLRFSKYIKDSVVFGGEDKPFISALIIIDLLSVGKWAEQKNLPFTTFTDLSQKSQVYDLIQDEIATINRTLPKEMRIKKFLNFYKEFDPDESELTRTRKIRRSFLEERYGELIEGLYGSEKQLFVEAEVKYRDGKLATLKTSVQVKECREED